jgi:two-component system nitrate/nitrite response regulator NarL
MADPIAHRPPQQSRVPSRDAKAIRILIIDDHVLVRNGLCILLERQDAIMVVGEAGNGPEALAIALSEQPDIILLALEVANDLEQLPELYRISPAARTIVLTGTSDLDTPRRAIRLGALGLVRKDQAIEVLLQAIAKVHAGEVWLEQTLVAEVLVEIAQGGPVRPKDPEAAKIATLTPREREVIRLAGQCLKNRQIAAHMRIAEATVRRHLTSIFAKLNVANRLDSSSILTFMASPPILSNHPHPRRSGDALS